MHVCRRARPGAACIGTAWTSQLGTASTACMCGQAEPLEVPERVRTAIERQQSQSEILIGWVQLGVVVVFGTLYALSPKTFDMDVMITPVPWALANSQQIMLQPGERQVLT